MNKYKDISKSLEKKNIFINNVLGFYRKPIFVTLISLFLVTVVSLLFIQVSKIEKAERKPLVVVVDTYYSRDDLKIYLEQYNINFEYYNYKVPVGDNETISQLQTYGVQRMYFSNTTILFYKSVIYINANGTLRQRNANDGKVQISTSLETIKEKVEEFGWA